MKKSANPLRGDVIRRLQQAILDSDMTYVWVVAFERCEKPEEAQNEMD